jgi:cytochrome c oxidase subunit IV
MSEQAHAADSHAEHHVVPLRVYYAVFAALLVLTLMTVEAARFDLGHPEWGGVRVPLNVIAALAIAVTKATLVVLYFMHVRYSTRLIWLVVGAAIFFLAILFGITGADYVSRGWLGNPGT